MEVARIDVIFTGLLVASLVLTSLPFSRPRVKNEHQQLLIIKALRVSIEHVFPCLQLLFKIGFSFQYFLLFVVKHTFFEGLNFG